MSQISEGQNPIEQLLELMERLRDPIIGCPWDIKQTYQSIAPSTLEEAYEVVDAIEKRNYPHLKEELGDLLFQVVFYSQLGKEDNHFDFNDVVQTLVDKLVRRHPHVFPDGTLNSRASVDENGKLTPDEDAVKKQWEEIKKEEREEKGDKLLLDDIPTALPAITRAAKIQKRAAMVGFDWADVSEVIDKLEEEIAELKEALVTGNANEIEDEMGDTLFSAINLSRHLKIEPEKCLRNANNKFEHRFNYIEKTLAKQEKSLTKSSVEEMEALWSEAKKRER
ncbi:MAG: nucleoside triphosphate pyrophosphohydrolase [Cellvibrionaceae bacterium]